MNLDDESLLSAYLDDELDEPRRLAVEGALKTNPRLADDLRALTRMRDVLSSLHRPSTSRDLAGPVVARLGAPRVGRGQRRLGLPLPRPHMFMLGAALSSAAGLLIATTIWVKQLAHSTEASRLMAAAGGVSHDLVPTAPSGRGPASEVDGKEGDRGPLATVAPKDSARVKLASFAVAGPDEEERKGEVDRQRILNYLDDPSVRRIFVTGDQIDAAGSDVDHLLRNTPRRAPRYGRVTVDQGIVIDPREPNRAIVFILVMDDKELNYLRGRLVKELHLAVRDDESVPAPMAMLLADIGQVDVITGALAAGLTEPPPGAPASVALKHDEAPDLPEQHTERGRFRKDLEDARPEGDTAVAQVPSPRDVRKSVVSRADTGAADTQRADPAKSNADEGVRKQENASQKADRLATVLVWVTSRPTAMP